MSLDRPQRHNLPRSIGLPTAIFILVGYVVGASIFILPGMLAAVAGPAIFVSYLIAGTLAFFACVATAQIGSALPVSGANIVLVSRALSPFCGFLYVWTLLFSVAVGLPLLGYGFAEYLAYFFPTVGSMTTALSVILAFALVNLLGASVAAWIQTFMVVEFVLALLVFGIGGLMHSQPALWWPPFPRGPGVVLLAAIPAYYSFIGLGFIAELGDEIKHPARNIPRTLAISFVLILSIYTMVPLAMTGLIPWQSLAETPAAVAVAAERFLPGWMAGVLALSALFATATSINGILMIQARDVYATAKDGILPDLFAHIHPRFQSPHRAVALIAAIAAAGTLLGQGVRDYAFLTVLGFMVGQSLVGVAILRLPAVLPQHYASAPFRLGRPMLMVFGSGLLLISFGFLLSGLADNGRSAILVAAILVAGSLIYRWRERVMSLSGRDLAETLRRDRSGVLQQALRASASSSKENCSPSLLVP